ncbi:MAG: septation regulator SpoVG [bacterium]|nr:septation regulator SpoVG [bacterium]
MEITEVRIFLKNEDRLKAYASITFDDAFVVRNLKVIYGKKGMFVSMPNRKTKDGEYKDVAHPVNNGMRDVIEKKVLDEYERKLKEEGLPMPKPPVFDELESSTSIADESSSFGKF